MFEAYKIGVRISLINHASMGLALLSKDFLRTESDAQKLESRIKSIKNMMIAGGAMTALGAGGLALFKGPLEEAKQFQTEVAKFTALGLGDATNRDAVKFAKGMDIMGSSARDNMVLLREATAIMGDFEHAKEVLPLLAKMKFGIESVMAGGSGAKFEQMFQAAIKTTELRGALIDRETGHVDLPNFKRVLDMMTQAYVASGGTVKPQDYLAAIKTGGVSTKLMNDEMFFFGLGHFMQESGGSRTGTASMSMFQNWAMGRMPQRVAEDMAKAGLLDPKAIQYGTTGHIKRVDAMGIKDAKQFTENPFEWVTKVAVPQLMAQGLKGNDLNIALAKLLGIRTAANLVDQFVREQKLAEKYIERSHKAQGIDGLYNNGKGTLQGKEIDLHAKWGNLLLRLGETVLPLAIRALERLIPMLENLTGWIDKNQTKVKILAGGFVLLSGALAFAGIVTMATGAIRGLTLAIGMLARASGAAAGGVGGAGAAAGLSMLGRMGQGAMAGLKLGGVMALATGAIDAYQVSQNDTLDRKAKQRAYGGVAGGVAGGVGGAYIGGAIGAAFGGIGAIPGALIGGAIGNWLGGKGGEAAVGLAQGDGKPVESQFIAQRPTQTVQVHSELKLDGRTIAEQVSTHQARALNRPLGSGMYDFGLALPPAGMNYAK
ncbi:hypothetical protein [Pandoraea pnomenusa]|uniref:hypothetical protein n=1 Tax=Pandoraea pnomenusa TaxID=93220 RepID=UPI003342B6F7